MTVVREALGYAPLYTLLITFLACYPLWGCALVGFGTVASSVRRAPKQWYVPAAGDLERAKARYPVVSVVIPAHDEEAMVAGAIERALAIRWPELDVIVVDDGSTDGTRAAARSYVADGRARLLSKPVNEGKSNALNDALGLCRGELVLVLDADGQADQLPWAAWYPLAYWLLSLLTVVRATIPGLVRRPRGLSTWNVPRTSES